MAKTIKFNIKLDGRAVRDLEGLREHFNVCEVLDYFRSGLLARWLSVREYEAESKELAKLRADDEIRAIARSLVEIFGIENDRKKIDEAIEIFAYEQKIAERNKIHAENNSKKLDIIKDYHNGYFELLETLKKTSEMPKLKAAAGVLVGQYLALFALDFRRLFSSLKADNPKALFPLMMLEDVRKFWLEFAKEMPAPTSMQKILGDELVVVKRDTDAVFDKIEPQETKIMVLHLCSKASGGEAAFIKDATDYKQKLADKDVNGKFPILDGLEYNTKNAANYCYYIKL